MTQRRISPVVTHIIGWLFFLSLPLAFLLRMSDGAELLNILSGFTFWQFCFTYVIIYYLHSLVLFPKLYLQKKKPLYFLVMLLLTLSVFFVKPFEQLLRDNRGWQRPEMNMSKPLPPNDTAAHAFSRPPGQRSRFDRRRPGPGIDIMSIILFAMTITLSIAMDITRRWRATEQKIALAEADKVNAELSFLKAQINPHFLFNTLNNIYSMAVTKNDNTAGTIMKLSNIMRYVTDEANEDYVSLHDEVDCITDYIDLQKLRLGKKVSLTFRVTGDLDNKRIAPLVLMTFIENLFKYGISSHEESQLLIELHAGEQRIDFFCQNPIFPTERRTERTGIGVANTRKRLAHLYPDKHRLDIKRENGVYSVELSLYS